jgi:hypothetical protein
MTELQHNNRIQSNVLRRKGRSEDQDHGLTVSDVMWSGIVVSRSPEDPTALTVCMHNVAVCTSLYGARYFSRIYFEQN